MNASVRLGRVIRHWAQKGTVRLVEGRQSWALALRRPRYWSIYWTILWSNARIARVAAKRSSSGVRCKTTSPSTAHMPRWNARMNRVAFPSAGKTTNKVACTTMLAAKVATKKCRRPISISTGSFRAPTGRSIATCAAHSSTIETGKSIESRNVLLPVYHVLVHRWDAQTRASEPISIFT